MELGPGEATGFEFYTSVLASVSKRWTQTRALTPQSHPWRPGPGALCPLGAAWALSWAGVCGSQSRSDSAPRYPSRNFVRGPGVAAREAGGDCSLGSHVPATTPSSERTCATQRTGGHRGWRAVSRPAPRDAESPSCLQPHHRPPSVPNTATCAESHHICHRVQPLKMLLTSDRVNTRAVGLSLTRRAPTITGL